PQIIARLTGKSDLDSNVSSSSQLVSGVQHTLVLNVVFNTTHSPCSAASLQNSFFGSTAGSQTVDASYRVISNGNVSFAGDVIDNGVINENTTDACNHDAWATLAEQAATAKGVNLSLYP